MCPFTPLPPKNPKNQNFEKMKNNCWRYYFTHVYQKSQSYDVWFLRYWVRHFLPFYPSNDHENQNFEKMKTKCLEILSFYTYMCIIHEDHVWFLKYKVWQTMFCPFGQFFALSPPPDDPENQNFGKLKKHLEISFYTYKSP